ncbi:hypothetical protein KM043_000586 [Ampulex compressa]|nr:hypothetical protein KM043_000586 [Ampulex compressa]
MAHRFSRLGSLATNAFKTFHTVKEGTLHRRLFVYDINLPKYPSPLLCGVRHVSFFNKRPAEQLWKGVTSVSNAGRRRGRGKGATKKKDLNKGQFIGCGKINILFPGLNYKVFRGKEIVEQKELPRDKEREEKIIQMRDSNTIRKKIKVGPLMRGWTSAKLGGKKYNFRPENEDETLEEFQSWILHHKTRVNITSNFGRRKKHVVLLVRGNGNGLASFALGTAPELKAALNKVQHRAGQRLMYAERYEDRTVVHDFHAQFGRSQIFVRKMYEGYGLVCHRAIKVCCEAFGIKDMYAKVEGAKNIKHVVIAFFIGLLRQKSFHAMANEKRLHLVEFKRENHNFPMVVASPSQPRTSAEVSSSEVLDFSQYIMGDRVVYNKKRPLPFYVRHKSYSRYMRKQERLRGQEDVRIRLLAQYGELRSFLADKYPEARRVYERRKEEAEGVK